jgi:hypothetical protein
MLNMNMPKIHLAGLTVFVCLYLLSACEIVLASKGASSSEDDSPPKGTYTYPTRSNPVTYGAKPFSSSEPYSSSVQKVSGSKPQTITLQGLNKHNVFVVMVNTSAKSIAVENTGYVVSSKNENTVPETTPAAGVRKAESGTKGLTGPVSGVFTGADGRTIVRYEHDRKNEEIMDAIRKGKLRAPASRKTTASSSGSAGGLLRSAEDVTPTPPTVDETTKTFWVQNGRFYTVNTTLRAIGERSNVWVADDNYVSGNSSDTTDNRITTAQAEALATNFDKIYELETPIFGFEYGGNITNTSDVNYGGADGDPRIQILVYDVDEDYNSAQTGGTFGYFFSGDEYTQDDFDQETLKHKSNQAEIFYLDAHFTDSSPGTMYSTLAHEFQHMINFNVKTLKSNRSSESGVWYNEMLSMLAEDLIDPLIEIDIDDNGHPVYNRISEFLQYYCIDDLTVWLKGDNSFHSYANAYAFGAYLVRNFGGVDLVQKMMADTQVDIASVNAALKISKNPFRDSGVNSFDTALARYGEAMLFSQEAGEQRPPGVLSFNNQVSKTIKGTKYTFYGFDIWDIYWTASGESGGTFYGPCVYNTDTKYSLKPRTMLLQSNSDWQNVRGDLEITIQPPTAPGVELYVMVR